MIKTRKSQTFLPIQEGVKYRTKMQTGDMFTVTRIIYRRKSKTDDTKIHHTFVTEYMKNRNTWESVL